MDFEFLAHLTWREALMVAVALLALYILFTFLRIHSLWDETRRVQELSPGLAQDAVSSYIAVQEERSARPPEEKLTAQAVKPESSLPADVPPSALNDSRQIEILEQDITQLRKEVGCLRAEMQALREEQQRESGKVQATRHTSPFYSNAMQLAAQGREAADISALCDISRSEAELLVVLAKNGDPGLREMK
jgi:hypothetical protein